MRWWDLLAKGSAERGEDFDSSNLTCPYCTGRGGFSKTFHAAQSDHSSYGGGIQSDIWKCTSCGNFTFVIWRRDPYHGGLRFMASPSRRPDTKSMAVPEEWKWPTAIGSAYVQAVKALEVEAWDAAATMARRAVQAATRAAKAKPSTPYNEIEELKSKGLLTPALAEWAHEVRLVGNDGAHPDGDDVVDEEDARQVTDFAYQLAMYLFTMPAEVEEHRKRRKAANGGK
jgi:hypothetical protein